MIPGEKAIIVVQIERVVFRKEDSGWCILATKPQTGDGQSAADVAGRRLNCKGVVAFNVHEGYRLQLEGRYGLSKFNGDIEFTFTAAMPHLPADMLSLLHYAVSITKGLGEQREAFIWSKYGETWIEQETLDIPGLPERVQANWRMTLQTINTQATQTQAITFLLSKGCTLNLASKAWEQWKENTVGLVTADCYQLASLPWCGFKKVDHDIRHHFGISDNDPRRLDAAILYVMGEITAGGSTLVPIWMAKAKVLELVPVADEEFDAGLDRVKTSGRLTTLEGGNLSLAGDLQAETAIWKRFTGLEAQKDET